MWCRNFGLSLRCLNRGGLTVVHVCKAVTERLTSLNLLVIHSYFDLLGSPIAGHIQQILGILGTPQSCMC